MTAYKGAKVLVAGASGMTGRNLLNYMRGLGANAIGTSFSKTIYDLIQIDFTDAVATKEFFDKFGPFDYVFICCAKTYNAFQCVTDPSSMIMPNINMASNILDNSLRTSCGKVLYISSATVYQPSNNILSEDELDWNKDPHDLYMGVGWAKRYIEKLCQFYSEHGLNTVVVRPTNIYGKYDKNDEKFSHVVPALINRALDKKDPYVIYGNMNAIKDFIYVDDFVRDISLVAYGYNSPDPINICSGSYITIEDLSRVILESVHRLLPDYFPAIENDNDGFGIAFRGVNKTKFESLFGKQKYTPIEKGIKEVVNWFSSLRQTPS